MSYPFKPFPFTTFPTLREFIDAAVKEGCSEHRLHGHIVGPQGPTVTRYLQTPSGVCVVLPNILVTERLAANQLRSLRRVLGIAAFADLLPEEDDDEDDPDAEEEDT